MEKNTCGDFTPIGILNVLSNVRTPNTQPDNRHSLLYKKISGYKRGHSIKTVLPQFRDNIIQAIQRVDLTMAIFVDFSKAFNTVDHTRILEKMRKMGLPKLVLHCILS